jgi:hypothetical protein
MLYSSFKAQVGVAFMFKQNFGHVSGDKIQKTWAEFIGNINHTHEDVI